MALKSNDARSPSRQIADELRRLIATGELGPDDQLPSNSEIQSSFGVSNATAQSAVSALKTDGLVYSVPGRGVFVRSDLDEADLLDHGAADLDPSAVRSELLSRIERLEERLEAVESHQRMHQSNMT